MISTSTCYLHVILSLLHLGCVDVADPLHVARHPRPRPRLPGLREVGLRVAPPPQAAVLLLPGQQGPGGDQVKIKD